MHCAILWVLRICISCCNCQHSGDTAHSISTLMLKLLMQRASSLEKTLILGKIENRRRAQQRMRQGWMASPGDAWCASVHGVVKSRTRLSDRTKNHPIEFSQAPLQSAPSLYSLITDNPWPASYPCSFACSRILYSWNHSVYKLFCLTQHDVFESGAYCCMNQ